jgi:hypothetical protein
MRTLNAVAQNVTLNQKRWVTIIEFCLVFGAMATLLGAIFFKNAVVQLISACMLFVVMLIFSTYRVNQR